LKIVSEDKGRRHFRALEVNGERVSHLGIYDHVMRIGPARVKMGGIGGVHTQWQHRKKGYARIVMEDSLRWMKREGYDVTILSGIEHFYDKFGFANCMPQVMSEVRTRDAEAILKEKLPYRTRRLEEADWPEMLRLYNRQNALRPLSLMRSIRTFGGIRHGSGFKRAGEAFVVLTRGGKFAGYAILDAFPEKTTACEIEVVEPDAMRAVFAQLTRIAIKRRDGEIAVQLPSDHPFTAYLTRFGSKTTSLYRNTGGMMGRIINQEALLSKLAAAYVARRGGVRSGTVTVKTEQGLTKVKIPSARRCGVSMPATTLFQVLVGFRTVEEALFSPGVKLSPGGEKALRFLASDLEPCMYSVDHF